MTETKSIIKDRDEWTKKAANLATELNPQQKEFCEAMLWCDTQTAAAKHAGYSEHSATVKAAKLMQMDSIKDYIEALQAMRAITTAFTDQTVIRLQVAVYDKAIEEGDLKAANTALNQLAGMLGTYNAAKNKSGSSEPEGAKTPKTLDQEAEMRDIVQRLGEREVA